MSGKHVLIVDDHKEAARLIRSHLERLNDDLIMEDVFSGEEALLEIGRGQIDLLIADVRLPGISGIELMRKFKARREDAHVILISGVTDEKIRQEVAQAGADAFFFKPIDMPEFLDAVERCLGLVDTILQPELRLHAQEIEEENNHNDTRVTEQISELHRSLNATAVLLVGEDGKVLFRNGSLPDPQLETALMPNLMAATNAGIKISHFLGQNRPDHFYSFRGENYDLFITPVGEGYCLLSLTRPILLSELSDIAVKMDAAAKQIMLSLARMGISAETAEAPEQASPPVEESPAPEPIQEPEPAPEPEPEPEAPANELPPDASLEDLFSSADKIKPQDADAFWESFSAEEIKPELSNGNSLSYDQAAQLGLAPSDE